MKSLIIGVIAVFAFPVIAGCSDPSICRNLETKTLLIGQRALDAEVAAEVARAEYRDGKIDFSAFNEFMQQSRALESEASSARSELQKECGDVAVRTVINTLQQRRQQTENTRPRVERRGW